MPETSTTQESKIRKSRESNLQTAREQQETQEKELLAAGYEKTPRGFIQRRLTRRERIREGLRDLTSQQFQNNARKRARLTTYITFLEKGGNPSSREGLRLRFFSQVPGDRDSKELNREFQLSQAKTPEQAREIKRTQQEVRGIESSRESRARREIKRDVERKQRIERATALQTSKPTFDRLQAEQREREETKIQKRGVPDMAAMPAPKSEAQLKNTMLDVAQFNREAEGVSSFDSKKKVESLEERQKSLARRLGEQEGVIHDPGEIFIPQLRGVTPAKISAVGGLPVINIKQLEGTRTQLPKEIEALEVKRVAGGRIVQPRDKDILNVESRFAETGGIISKGFPGRAGSISSLQLAGVASARQETQSVKSERIFALSTTPKGEELITEQARTPVLIDQGKIAREAIARSEDLAETKDRGKRQELASDIFSARTGRGTGVIKTELSNVEIFGRKFKENAPLAFREEVLTQAPKFTTTFVKREGGTEERLTPIQSERTKLITQSDVDTRFITSKTLTAGLFGAGEEGRVSTGATVIGETTGALAGFGAAKLVGTGVGIVGGKVATSIVNKATTAKKGRKVLGKSIDLATGDTGRIAGKTVLASGGVVIGKEGIEGFETRTQELGLKGALGSAIQLTGGGVAIGGGIQKAQKGFIRRFKPREPITLTSKAPSTERTIKTDFAEVQEFRPQEGRSVVKRESQIGFAEPKGLEPSKAVGTQELLLKETPAGFAAQGKETLTVAKFNFDPFTRKVKIVELTRLKGFTSTEGTRGGAETILRARASTAEKGLPEFKAETPKQAEALVERFAKKPEGIKFEEEGFIREFRIPEKFLAETRDATGTTILGRGTIEQKKTEGFFTRLTRTTEVAQIPGARISRGVSIAKVTRKPTEKISIPDDILALAGKPKQSTTGFRSVSARSTGVGEQVILKGKGFRLAKTRPPKPARSSAPLTNINTQLKANLPKLKPIKSAPTTEVLFKLGSKPRAGLKVRPVSLQTTKGIGKISSIKRSRSRLDELLDVEGKSKIRQDIIQRPRTGQKSRPTLKQGSKSIQTQKQELIPRTRTPLIPRMGVPLIPRTGIPTIPGGGIPLIPIVPPPVITPGMDLRLKARENLFGRRRTKKRRVRRNPVLDLAGKPPSTKGFL